METKGRAWNEESHVRSSVTTWVPSPVEKVFAYVADFSRHHEWARNEITVTPVTPAPVGLGSKYRSVGKQGGKEWPADLEVTAYEPPGRFEFTATGGPLDAPIGDPHRHEFLLRSENSGTSLELRRTDPKPPGMSALVWQLFGYVFAHATLRWRIETVENLRRQLERQVQKL